MSPIPPGPRERRSARRKPAISIHHTRTYTDTTRGAVGGHGPNTEDSYGASVPGTVSTDHRWGPGQQIPWHYDRSWLGWHASRVLDTICIYLTDSVGTEFDPGLQISAGQGDVIVFGTAWKHRGLPVQQSRKQLLMFRVGRKENVVPTRLPVRRSMEPRPSGYRSTGTT